MPLLLSVAALAADPKTPAKQTPSKPVPAEPETAQPKPATAKGQFIRLRKDAAGKPLALEAAIVRCAAEKPGLTVDLISAVHIGERAYFEQLNREFARYEVVLYELVAPTGTRIPKGGGKGGGSWISVLQKGMKDMLALEYQLEVIDYTAKNLVHADMSPDEFRKAMKDRGESFVTIFIRMMGYALARQSQGADQPDELQILLALFDKNRSVALRQVLAGQMEEMEGSLMAIEGPEGSALISGRNQKAMEVFEREVAAGKKRIAIFYGAGHMPDFQKRLKQDHGLAPTETRWLTAWDLKSPPPKAEKPKADKSKPRTSPAAPTS
jgi:hypothetical protein